MKNFLMTVFLCLLSIFGAEARTGLTYPQYYISGVVYSLSEDKSSKITLEGAAMELIAGKDTLRTVSARSGKFFFKFNECFEVTLKVSYLGYRDYEEKYKMDQSSAVIAIEMTPDNKELESAVVKGEIPFMTVNADTTSFNTAAIEKMENDPAIKLLKSIPGFELKDGTLYFEGEPVTKTYVNGKLIFGDNSLKALSLLDADEVKSVNVYDQQTALDKRRGMKNSKKERVLNLKTFKEFTKASDLMAQTRIGLDNRYSAGLRHSYDSEMLNTWTELNSNNICDNSNNSNSVLRSAKVMDADLTHHEATASFSKKWKDAEYGNILTGNYSFGYDRSISSSLKTIDRLEGPSGKEGGRYTEASSTDDMTRMHYVLLMGEFNDTPVKSIGFSTNLSFSDAKVKSLEEITNNMSGIGVASQNQKRNDSHRAFNFCPSLDWSHPDIKGGWMPLLKMKCNIGRSEEGMFNLDTLSSSYNKRFLQGSGSGINKSWEGSVSIRKKREVTKRLTTEKEFVLCEVSHNNSSMDKLTIDRLASQGTGRDSIDITNSCKYTWNDTKVSSGFKYFAYGSGMLFTFVTGISYLKQKDDESFPIVEHEDKTYVLPALSFVSLDYAFKGGHRVNTSYSIESDIPSIEQTRERITNTNPVRLQIGNPDLYNSTNHAFALNYFSKPFSKGKTVSAQLKLEKRKNAIVDKVQYFSSPGLVEAWGTRYAVPAGATLTGYENADGMMRLSVESKYSMRVKALKGNFSTGLTFNAFQTPQYDGEILNKVISNRPSFNVSLNTVPVSKVLRLSLDNDVAYLNERNNSGAVLAEAFIESFKASSEVRFLKSAFWDTSYSCSLVRYGSGTGVDTDFHNLSTAVGFMLLKGRMGISISGSNLLDKATNYLTSSTSSEFTQIWRNTFGRYFLLNITYRVKDRR